VGVAAHVASTTATGSRSFTSSVAEGATPGAGSVSQVRRQIETRVASPLEGATV